METVLRLVLLEVKIGEVLGCRKVVLCELQGRLEIGNCLLRVEGEWLQQKGKRLLLILFELHDLALLAEDKGLLLGVFFLLLHLVLLCLLRLVVDRRFVEVFENGRMYFSWVGLVFIEIGHVKDLLLDFAHVWGIFDLALDQGKLSECMLLDVSFFLILHVFQAAVDQLQFIVGVVFGLVVVRLLVAFDLLLRWTFLRKFSLEIGRSLHW